MPLPPPEPTVAERARQKLILQVAVGILVVGALAVVVFAQAIPLPARLFVAATDLVIAAVLVVLLRQKFPPT